MERQFWRLRPVQAQVKFGLNFTGMEIIWKYYNFESAVFES